MRDPQKPATSKFQPLQSSRKVFDVAMPGTLPPSPTSRPVIPTPNPPVADGQFVSSRPARLVHTMPQLPSVFNQHKTSPLRLEESTSPATKPLPTPNKASIEPRRQPQRVISNAILSREVDLVDAEPETDSLLGPTNDQEVAVAADPTSELQVESQAEDSDSPSQASEEQQSPVSESAPDVPSAVEPVATEADPPEERPKPHGTPRYNQPFGDQKAAQRVSDDDIVANTNAPLFDPQQMIVSHHRQSRHVWRFVLVFVLTIIVAGLTCNFLLDAGILQPSRDIPHTHLLGD
jgi:hypothetical protein